MPRTMHMLNSQGHVTIHWEPQNDAQVLPVIERMLAQGYRFFILDENQAEVPVTSTAEVATERHIMLADESLQQLHDAGLIQVGGVTIEEHVETVGVAATAEDVAAHDTVATKPARGG
jgi:hypothetical protein